jgi:hypothetical protein
LLFLSVTSFTVSDLFSSDHLPPDLFHAIAVPVFVYAVSAGIEQGVVVISREILYGGTAQSHLAVGMDVVVVEGLVTENFTHHTFLMNLVLSSKWYSVKFLVGTPKSLKNLCVASIFSVT